MNSAPSPAEMAEIRSMARPLAVLDDLDPLVDRLGEKRYVCIGEASHGTHEYYVWRCELSRRLIERHDFAFIGVEGDWPDCWRVNRWVRGLSDQQLDARGLLADFERWPTWMWANEEVADFLDWLRVHNSTRPASRRVGFYGLDVYSLWDSLREIFTWLEQYAPDAIPEALQAWRCFAPYGEDPQEYARSTRLVPESCEQDVVDLLVAVRRRTAGLLPDDEDAFDAAQNAEVVAGAEHYYREMVKSGRQSWNVRDIHMSDTLDRLTGHFGPDSKALVWAHNTHVGDARATDMASAGMVNVGEIARERHGPDEVALIGFAGHRGGVIAAAAWGATERALRVPEAQSASHEDVLHHALGESSVLVFPEERTGPWLRSVRGHRAIGVVYQPRHEADNYVPTRMGARYDALIWLEDTTPLTPLHHEQPPREPEYETEPTGF
jgi:erythromycin esterase